MNRRNQRPSFGDIYWICDRETGLPKEAHPWIVIEDYDPVRPAMKACVRSTTVPGSVEIPYIYNNIQVDDFDKDGCVDPTYIKVIPVYVISAARYRGRLPQELLQRLRDALP